MPTYDYRCQDCEHEFDVSMRMSDYDSSIKPPCPACGAEEKSVRAFSSPPMVAFVGDGWASKNLRVASQMRAKNVRLAAKEREQKGDGMVPTLAPNVNGERVGSWAEATKLAQSKGKDTSGYEARARKEKAGNV